jgi:hypothetical protein
MGMGLMLVSLAWAAPDVTVPRKPAPDAQTQPYRERLESLIESRYPRLTTQRITGTALVTVLFDADGTLAASNLEIMAAPVSVLTASELRFASFGLAAGELKYLGVARISLPRNTILVIFGEKDSRELDLALVAHLFPNVLAQGVPAGQGIWVLFDHDGKVLRSGQERFEAKDLRRMLEARFRGIRTSDMTVTPVIDRQEPLVKPSRNSALQLHCVWLAVGSSLPAP